MIGTEEKLQACKTTRQIAASTFTETLRSALQQRDQISETKLRDDWLARLRACASIFPDGWYMPPPHGIGILFGTDNNVSRVSPGSIRPDGFWPRDNAHLHKDTGLIFVYASPVDKETGMIGDFGLMLYLGKQSSLLEHMKTCFRLNQEIFEYIQIGQSLGEVSQFAHQVMKKRGLSNKIISISDSSGTNIGHTVPASYEPWIVDEQRLLNSGSKSWSPAKDMISQKRRFVRDDEPLVIKPGIAFTIEPRVFHKDAHHPLNVFFHTICLIHEDGRKELLTNFDDVFRLCHMEYLLV